MIIGSRAVIENSGDALSITAGMGTAPTAGEPQSIQKSRTNVKPMFSNTDPATIHYQRIPLQDHTTLHKVQIRDLPPTQLHDIELVPAPDTVWREAIFELGDPTPTVYHDVELTYIPGPEDGGEMQIVARGEYVEPELLIKTETEDILVERVHPALIVKDPNEEDPFLVGKSHMETVNPSPEEVSRAIPGVDVFSKGQPASSHLSSSLSKVPMEIRPHFDDGPRPTAQTVNPYDIQQMPN
jgi:hypothetical protein